MTIMQEMFGEIKGKLLTIVTGYSQLSFQLALGSLQLPLRK